MDDRQCMSLDDLEYAFVAEKAKRVMTPAELAVIDRAGGWHQLRRQYTLGTIEGIDRSILSELQDRIGIAETLLDMAVATLLKEKESSDVSS